MTETVKKSILVAMVAVLFGLLLPLPDKAVVAAAPAQSATATSLPYAASARLPYIIDAAFFRADHATVDRLPAGIGTLTTVFLAVTVTPLEPGVSLYASAGQAQGQTPGKITEISVAAEGTPLRSRVVFPKGTEKPDPLVPGAVTRMFEGAFTALVPVPETVLPGQSLDVRLTGLACSAVNCTPLVLTRTAAMPETPAIAALPDAAAAPWWDALVSGVAEPMGEIPVAASSPLPRFGAMPLSPSSNAAFIREITPVPFTPGLEVTSLSKAALLGFLAGIILNLMPCVLPVLGIKLASLLGHGNDTSAGLRRFRLHQVFFALGILAWFAVLAGLLHFLHLAWGQIFQSPVVVFVLALLLLLLALSLFGLFSLPLIDLRADTAKNPHCRAFAEGFGATLLATPCGGPLLGGVLSWALLQPFGVLALTLASIGLGMAFPYLVLAAFPALATRLPRPGAWMRTMEQVLGFLLLGTVAYLVSFLPSDMAPRVVASLVLAAFGCWLWHKRWLARLVGVVCLIAACVWPFMARPAGNGWSAYSHAAFAQVLGKRPVLVDFTADWCPTCKLVEATALREANLRVWEQQYGLALFRVDITHNNPEGEALLRAVGSVSIPVIAVFPAGEDAFSPLVLRDIVTAGQVKAALDSLQQRQEAVRP